MSSLDAQFLHVENATTAGHVGSLILLDPATTPTGELTLGAVREVLEQRLHLLAPLRQRLLPVPMGLGLPYWVDDPDFDIEFHLREVGLPAPGDDRQLGEQVARIHARPLDRTHPLWEMYLIHNVSAGRQALYTKIHHAAIDGVSGAEILATVMDPTIEPRLEPAPEEVWAPPPLPGAATMLGHGLAAMAAQPFDVVRTLPKALPHLADLPGASYVPGARMVSDLADAVAQLATGESEARAPVRRSVTAPPTPLNGPITAHRRFAFGSLPLTAIKRVKDAFALTVNDVVMALCTSALRRWLLDHDGLPSEPIVVAVPVSVRAGDRADESPGEGANQISVMLAEMPTQVADPAERLVLVQAAMAEAKQQFEAVPASILRDLSNAVPTALAGLAARAVFQMAAVAGSYPFNLFVSNVPGPQVPLYVAGAIVEGVYPVSAISDLTGALNVTLFSYDGSLDFGLIACRELLPDVWNLIGYLDDALQELLDLVAAA